MRHPDPARAGASGDARAASRRDGTYSMSPSSLRESAKRSGRGPSSSSPAPDASAACHHDPIPNPGRSTESARDPGLPGRDSNRTARPGMWRRDSSAEKAAPPEATAAPRALAASHRPNRAAAPRLQWGGLLPTERANDGACASMIAAAPAGLNESNIWALKDADFARVYTA